MWSRVEDAHRSRAKIADQITVTVTCILYFDCTNDPIRHFLEYSPTVHLGSISKKNVLADRVTM